MGFDRLKGEFLGKVVDNKDPLNMGRIKVNIENIMEGDIETLPYITPCRYTTQGYNKEEMNTDINEIPEIDDLVKITFKNNDIMSGVWHSIDNSIDMKLNENLFNDDITKDSYPFTFGKILKRGFRFIADNTPNKIKRVWSWFDGYKVKSGNENKIVLDLTKDKNKLILDLPTYKAHIEFDMTSGAETIKMNWDTVGLNNFSIDKDGNAKLDIKTHLEITCPKIDVGTDGNQPMVLGDNLADWIKNELKPQFDNHIHIGNMGSPTSSAISSPSGELIIGTAEKGNKVYSKKNTNQ